jgi:hypothetical protein
MTKNYFIGTPLFETERARVFGLEAQGHIQNETRSFVYPFVVRLIETRSSLAMLLPTHGLPKYNV